MTIREIFAVMQACGLTNSQVEFSSVWLGRSGRYYSHLVAVGREPGVATLCGMVWRLDRLIEQMPPANIARLVELQRLLTNRIQHRSVTDRQKRRF